MHRRRGRRQAAKLPDARVIQDFEDLRCMLRIDYGEEGEFHHAELRVYLDALSTGLRRRIRKLIAALREIAREDGDDELNYEVFPHGLEYCQHAI